MVQTTATLDWPQHGQLGNVTAPLISQVPVTLQVSIPCETVEALPASGGLLLGTAPADGKQAALNAMLVTVSAKRVDVIVRNVVVASVPRTALAGTAGTPGCSRIDITSSEAGTYATFVGVTDPKTGREWHTGFTDPNLRPQIVGVFTDLTGPAPAGLEFSATIDTRFTTKPTAMKLTAILVAITATVVALLALWRLDRLDGRRMRRLIPTRWRTLGVVDGVVVAGFALWHVLGIAPPTTATSWAWPVSPGTPGT